VEPPSRPEHGSYSAAGQGVISGGSLPLAGKLLGSRRHRTTVAMPMLRAVAMSVRRRRSALFLRKGKVPDRKTTLPRKTGAARDPLPSHPVDDDSRTM